MEFLSYNEAQRALRLAVSLCQRAADGEAVRIDSADIEIVALGLFLAVQRSEHAEEVVEATTAQATEVVCRPVGGFRRRRV